MRMSTNFRHRQIFLWCFLLPCVTLGGSIESSSAATEVVTQEQCGFTVYDELTKFHLDDSCDRATQNSYANRLIHFERAKELHASAAAAAEATPDITGIPHVPPEKTVICPLAGGTLSSSSSSSSAAPSSLLPDTSDGRHLGFLTRWLVENTSKVPVVIAYVDHSSGLEYSAVNVKIAPPQADPQAILMPHEWKSVRALEGHVFHVYELIGGSSVAGNFQLGRLVLQHRVGLVPVRNRLAPPEEVDCGDRRAIVDESPEGWEPSFRRTMATTNEHCNVLYRGFRNMVGCPVHAYYIGQSTLIQQQLSQAAVARKEAASTATTTTADSPTTDVTSAFFKSNNVNAAANSTTTGLRSCQGEFKFHLGVNTRAHDFENDWDSTTKFETSFVSHTFVFRLASNTNVVVDSHTLTPTQVVDCPTSDSAITTSVQNASPVAVHIPASVSDAFVLPSGTTDEIKNGANVHNVVVMGEVMPQVRKMALRNATCYVDADDDDDEYYYCLDSGTYNSSLEMDFYYYTTNNMATAASATFMTSAASMAV